MDNEPSPASGIDAFRDLERYLSGAVGGLAEIERESERRGREILRLALQASPSSSRSSWTGDLSRGRTRVAASSYRGRGSI